MGLWYAIYELSYCTRSALRSSKVSCLQEISLFPTQIQSHLDMQPIWCRSVRFDSRPSSCFSLRSKYTYICELFSVDLSDLVVGLLSGAVPCVLGDEDHQRLFLRMCLGLVLCCTSTDLPIWSKPLVKHLHFHFFILLRRWWTSEAVSEDEPRALHVLQNYWFAYLIQSTTR